MSGAAERHDRVRQSSVPLSMRRRRGDRIRGLFAIGILLLLLSSAASAQPFTINGKLKYGAAPTTPAATPQFFLRDDSSGQQVNASISYSGSTFQIRNLPAGSYTLIVDADENAGNPRLYPGDFDSKTTFDAATAASSGLVVELRRVMHLTSPQDNASTLPAMTDECTRPVVSTAPVVFAWDSIATAVLYDYSIERMSCVTPYQAVGALVRGSTAATSLAEILPPNGPNDIYVFSLWARNAAGVIVGGLITHYGPGAFSWDDRFRVELVADLAVTKTIKHVLWLAPKCTITIRNLGPSAATGVVLTDVSSLSRGSVLGVSAPAGWTCDRRAQTITCRKATFARRESATFVIGLSRDFLGTDTVTVRTSSSDPNPRNNSATAGIP